MQLLPKGAGSPFRGRVGWARSSWRGDCQRLHAFSRRGERDQRPTRSSVDCSGTAGARESIVLICQEGGWFYEVLCMRQHEMCLRQGWQVHLSEGLRLRQGEKSRARKRSNASPPLAIEPAAELLSALSGAAIPRVPETTLQQWVLIGAPSMRLTVSVRSGLPLPSRSVRTGTCMRNSKEGIHERTHYSRD